LGACCVRVPGAFGLAGVVAGFTGVAGALVGAFPGPFPVFCAKELLII